MLTPSNPDIDHLDPANWWPAYDMETDRRMLPLRTWSALPGSIEAWYHGNDEFRGDWYWVTASAAGWTAVDVGPLVNPDQPVYIAQADFERALPHLSEALGECFAALWAYHKAGKISRHAFDQRSEKLRVMRDHINIVTGA